MRLDKNAIRAQIEALLAAYPELAEDEILRADMIEGETEAVEFLRQIERRRQEAATLAEAIGLNVDALRERMARFNRREEAFRALMFKILQIGNLRKLEMPEATVSVRIGVPRVLITDENAIPDDLCRIKREPDRVKIKQALSEFKPVPGATLSNAEDTLAIRVK